MSSRDSRLHAFRVPMSLHRVVMRWAKSGHSVPITFIAAYTKLLVDGMRVNGVVVPRQFQSVPVQGPITHAETSDGTIRRKVRDSRLPEQDIPR